jgi:hypothetical protein
MKEFSLPVTTIGLLQRAALVAPLHSFNAGATSC